MNSVNLIGRVGNDLEKRFTQTGKSVVNFVLFVRRDKDTSDHFRCSAFDKTADMMLDYVKKGDMIGLSGSLQSRDYTNKDNKKTEVVEIVTNRVDLLTKKDPASQPAPRPPYRPSEPPQDDEMDFHLDISSDDLPF